MCLGWSLQLDSYIGLCHMSADFSNERERERERERENSMISSSARLDTEHVARSMWYVIFDVL